MPDSTSSRAREAPISTTPSRRKLAVYLGRERERVDLPVTTPTAPRHDEILFVPPFRLHPPRRRTRLVRRVHALGDEPFEIVLVDEGGELSTLCDDKQLQDAQHGVWEATKDTLKTIFGALVGKAAK
jgi:hypothetical protein